MIDERLAPNFWLSELLQSEQAVRFDIRNDPTPEALANLRGITGPGMQKVRNLLGCPVSINSGYRGPELNRRVGGSATSQHCEGLAVDFTAASFGTPLVVARKLRDHLDELRIDQLIWEGTWIHVSWTRGTPRRQVMTATFPGGKAKYTQGLPT